MDQDRAERALRRVREQFAVPGAQLGLLRGHDRVVVSDGELAAGGGAPVERGTRFHAGSIAKSLCALVVVDAARRGELELDKGCDAQAPGLWSDTPRALMAQTTGRPNTLPELDDDLGEFVARVAAMPRIHAPGRFSYCNAGWPVLDLLLRERVGAGFEELARDRVLGAGAAFGEPPGAAQGHGVSPDGAVSPVDSVVASSASAAGARWWASADELLDYAALHLGLTEGAVAAEDLRELRRPQAQVPGATVSDAWGLGWALWDRGDHHAFGWSGYTGGHRALLRCFPEQGAAVVLLANGAGPLLGPPGGSALIDTLLPEAIDLLGVPPLPTPRWPAVGTPTEALAGTYGPLSLATDGPDGLVLGAAAFGEPEPVAHTRLGGDTFGRRDGAPGGMSIAIDGDLLYVGPFAVPRS